MFICAWVCLRRGWAKGGGWGGKAKDIYVNASVTLNAFLPNQLTSLTKKALLRYQVKVMEITLFLYIKVLNNLHIYILRCSQNPVLQNPGIFMVHVIVSVQKKNILYYN